eukprot:10433442-Karenia_brevis.AAC.1
MSAEFAAEGLEIISPECRGAARLRHRSRRKSMTVRRQIQTLEYQITISKSLATVLRLTWSARGNIS